MNVLKIVGNRNKEQAKYEREDPCHSVIGECTGVLYRSVPYIAIVWLHILTTLSIITHMIG